MCIDSGNASRHVHNRRDLICYASLSSAANSRALPVISLFAEFTSRTTHTTAELRELFKLPDEKTNKLPMCLNIYPGMWVMITENIATVRISIHVLSFHIQQLLYSCLIFLFHQACGVSNGTIAKVLDIQFEADTTFTRHKLSAHADDVNCYSLVPSLPPVCIFLKLRNGLTTHIARLPEHVPHDSFPLTCKSRLVKVQLPSRRGFVDFTLKQFPLVPATAVTMYDFYPCQLLIRFLIFTSSDTNYKGKV